MKASRESNRGPAFESGDETFDRKLHECYADAASHLSVRTRAQLQQRLRTAMAQQAHGRRSRGPAWILATACSLALVAAVGLQWRAQEASAPRAPAPIAYSSDNGELVATLEETPDLYLWLASDDAIALASE
jgi:hypothetical protein